MSIPNPIEDIDRTTTKYIYCESVRSTVQCCFARRSIYSICIPLVPEMADDIKYYTLAEVAKHKTNNDVWLVIHNGVYNVTEFLNEVS